MFVGGIHIDASLARLRSGAKSKTGHDRPIRMVDRHGPGEVLSHIGARSVLTRSTPSFCLVSPAASAGRLGLRKVQLTQRGSN